jgi:hypothetical protein
MNLFSKFAYENPRFSFVVLLAWSFLLGFVTCLFTVK